MVYPVSREGVVLSQPYMELDEAEHWSPLSDLRVKLAKRQRDLRSEP